MIEATITLDELKRAVALIEQAHARGYTASVAVLALAAGGRGIEDCVLVADGLLLTDGGAHNYGRQSSTKNVADLSRDRARRPKRTCRPGTSSTACDHETADESLPDRLCLRTARPPTVTGQRVQRARQLHLRGCEPLL